MEQLSSVRHEEVVAAKPDPRKQKLLSQREVGTAAKISTELRATRCFVLPADDNHVKWIWAAESQPELREMGRALRGSGVLSQLALRLRKTLYCRTSRPKLSPSS